MTCEFKTTTNTKSLFYDSLEAKYGGVVAKKLWLSHKTESFIESYSGARRQNGEPTIKGFEEWATINPAPRIRGKEEISKQKKLLQKAFEDAGINISFKSDDTHNGAAKVEGSSDNGFTITYNPHRIGRDSLFHEAGHLLVDLLGVNNPVVQRAIKSLQGSKLWEIVYNSTNYVGERLQKEVLATALGLHAVGELDQFIDKKPLLINRILRLIAEFFGIETSAINKLTKQLTGGKIRGTLLNNITSYQEFQASTLISEQDTLYIETEKAWLETHIANLHKTAARFKHQGGSSKEFANRFLELIDQMKNAETAEAIMLYMEFANNRIFGIEKRLMKEVEVNGKTVLYKDLKYEDIKSMSAEEQRKHISFLYYTRAFVTQWVDIGSIPVIENMDKAEALLLGKRLAEKIKDIDVVWERLAKETYIKLVEASSNPLFGGVGAIENIQEFFNTVNDENWAQRRFDALADTNNPFISSLMKIYARSQRKAKNEKKARIILWNKMLKEKAEAAGMSTSDFLNQYMEYDEDGDATGRVISDIDYPSYFAEKSKYIDEPRGKLLDKLKIIAFGNEYLFEVLYANARVKRTVDGFTDAYATLSPAKQQAYNEFYTAYRAYSKEAVLWFTENTEPIPNADELISKQQQNYAEGKITKVQYDNWMEENTGENYIGQFYYKKRLVRPNIEVWGNKKLETLDKEFHNYLTTLLAELVDHVSDEAILNVEGDYSNIIRKGYFPALPKDERTKLEKFKEGIGWYDTVERNLAVDEAGEVIRFIPLRYVNRLSSEAFENAYVFPDGTTGADLKEMSELDRSDWITNNRAEYNKMKRKSHGKAMETDIDLAMAMFINHSVSHRHKKEIEHEILVGREILRKSKMFKKDGKGLNIKDKFLSAEAGANRFAEIDAESSNTFKHFEDWLNMIFYDDFEIDEGALTKVSRVLQNFTSLKGLGFNPLSALNNVVYGTIQIQIEAIAGQHFGGKNIWRQAKVEYAALKNLASYFADINQDTASTKVNAFFRHYDILRTQEELANPNTMSAAKKGVSGYMFSTQPVYALQHIGEHMMQNQALLAMAYSHRIIEGRIVSYNEFIEGKLLPVLKDELGLKIDVDTSKQNIEKNKELEKTLKAQFEEHLTVYDSYVFENGFVNLKEDIKLEEGEESDFEQKVLSVNHYLHGIYNREDAGAIQKYALGRLAIHFRKWMRPGWNKRFGSRFGQTYWNDRRKMKDEGMYFTTYRFITSPIRDELGNTVRDENGERNIGKAISNILKGYAEFFKNFKVHWHSMDVSERANVMRSFAELAFLGFIFTLGLMLKGMKDDDDKEKNSLLLYSMLHQYDRTMTELLTYTPVYGWFNEGKKLLKSPMAAFGTISMMMKLIGATFNEVFSSDEEGKIFQGGVYRKENKAYSYLIRNIPIANQFYRMAHIDQNYRFYKMF